MRSRRGQRSQAMVEFALISPLLVLMLFGIVDLGRVIYYYIAVGQSIGEASRVASIGTTANGLPTNADVLAAGKTSANYLTLAPCPNDPPSVAGNNSGPAAGVGWLSITAPAGGNPDSSNSPGGETGAVSGCSPAVPARAPGQDNLQVWVEYNFTPFTPLMQQITGGRVLLTWSSEVPVEY